MTATESTPDTEEVTWTINSSGRNFHTVIGKRDYSLSLYYNNSSGYRVVLWARNTKYDDAGRSLIHERFDTLLEAAIRVDQIMKNFSPYVMEDLL